MKLDLALDRKLLLLVGIPLGGALIFAGILIGRLFVDLYALHRADTTLDLMTDLAAVRQAVLAEQRDSWDLYSDVTRGAAYRGDAETTSTVLSHLKARTADLNIGSHYGADAATAISGVLAISEPLSGTRDFFNAKSSGGDPMESAAVALRGRYVDAQNQALDAMNLLTLTTDSAPLRARLDGVVWFGRLALAAEDERTQTEAGFAQKLPTIAQLSRIQNATSQRVYCESNAKLMAPTALLGYWNSVLAAPAYVRANTLSGTIFNTSALQSNPLRPELHPEWTTVTHQRTEIIDGIEPHLLDEARAFVATNRAVTEHQLVRFGSSLALLLAISLTIAFVFIRRINRQLRGAFTGLDAGVEEIIGAVGALSAGAERLANSATREAAGLEQTGASLGSLTTANQQNVDIARQNVDHMKHTGELVANSRHAMQSLTETMVKISESSAATFRIVKTIDEIAFQTSILAFNASIEAASAGAAGTGFTVVAEEVRDLSKRASEATAETGRLVEDSRTAISRGEVLNHEVETALADVEANASRASELMLGIHTASQQMLQNMQHINTGNKSMETVTQQNAAIAEHNTKTANMIAEETQKLLQTIRSLERTLMGVRRQGDDASGDSAVAHAA